MPSPKSRVCLVVTLFTLVAATACTTVPVTSPAATGTSRAASVAATPDCFRDVAWYRTSAEKRAAYAQAFRYAGERVRALSAGRAAGTWGVVLDIDETVLDNSEFQEAARRSGTFEEPKFQAWCRERRATALPGARAFLALVHALGGRIAFVSNRFDVVCPDTRANLDAQDLAYDEVLCRANGATSDKNPRFEAIRAGAAPSTLPPLDIVLFVGDNIQDFPGLAEDAMRAAPDAAYAEFGARFIQLPNPIYGAWVK